MIPLYVLVHPVDTTEHPTYGEGWRWAVMVGEGAFTDMGRCANAGWCPTREEALAEGNQNAATAAAAAQIIAVQVSGAFPRPPVELDHDPIPAEADHLPLRTV